MNNDSDIISIWINQKHYLHISCWVQVSTNRTRVVFERAPWTIRPCGTNITSDVISWISTRSVQYTVITFLALILRCSQTFIRTKVSTCTHGRYSTRVRTKTTNRTRKGDIDRTEWAVISFSTESCWFLVSKSLAVASSVTQQASGVVRLSSGWVVRSWPTREIVRICSVHWTVITFRTLVCDVIRRIRVTVVAFRTVFTHCLSDFVLVTSSRTVCWDDGSWRTISTCWANTTDSWKWNRSIVKCISLIFQMISTHSIINKVDKNGNKQRKNQRQRKKTKPESCRSLEEKLLICCNTEQEYSKSFKNCVKNFLTQN